MVMISDNRPVALFDSGLGGLTALSALQELMPEENIIYFADSGRVPYGAKTPSQLRVMAKQDIDFAVSKGAKAIIAACGTVSSNAAAVLESCEIPVIGVLKPGVQRACSLGGDAPIGVIATAASIKSGAFERMIRELSPKREVISAACPDFVTLIEGGHSSADDALVIEAVEKYLAEIKAKNVSVLILGCTHYGIISEAIRNFLGEDVILVSASACAAEAMRDYLTAEGITGGESREEFYTSGSAEEFSKTAAILLGRELRGSISSIPAMEVPAE